MTRQIVECPTPPQKRDPWRGLERIEYDIALVTPMFGGGVVAGEIDPVTLIRPSSIRGHLRFWWRATCGAGCTEPADLRQREISIWGDTKQPSHVIVQIELRDRGRVEPCAVIPPGKRFPQTRPGYPGYALFPFQGGDRDIGKGVHDARFTLQLNFPAELAFDVQTSIWAWVNFGGIGARTRRGCGTLWCSQLGPPDGSRSEVQKWLKEGCANYKPTAPTTSPSWPKLGWYWMGPRSSSPSEAWSEVIALLRDFRQGVGTGRNPGTEHNRPGRSRWPEAESIRRATGHRSGRHQPAGNIPDDAFPRAEFGMPIVFHFKDGPPEDSRRSPRELGTFDPAKTELHPVVGADRKTRMASPLILKPLAVSSKLAFPIILLLNAPQSSAVALVRDSNLLREFPQTSIRNPDFAAYPYSPLGASGGGMPARSADGSAVEAFLAFAMEKGFTEVSL